jgi:two-component system, OmpR family, copper resistance phosphate regulon response regulator CusR
MHRILIAEDESRIAAFIDKGLRKHGFETAIVNNGNDVLEKLRTEAFNLLLLDIGLPGKNGLTVLTELRQSQQLIPVVVVTAIDEEANRQVTLDLGANDYLPKPFQFVDLLASIKNQLNSLSNQEKRRFSAVNLIDSETLREESLKVKQP